MTPFFGFTEPYRSVFLPRASSALLSSLLKYFHVKKVHFTVMSGPLRSTMEKTDSKADHVRGPCVAASSVRHKAPTGARSSQQAQHPQITSHKMTTEHSLPSIVSGTHTWTVGTVIGTGAFSECRLATCGEVPAVLKTTFLSDVPAARAKQLLYIRREIECLSRLRGNVHMYVLIVF